jgi:AcrR family transcriptional regulator
MYLAVDMKTRTYDMASRGAAKSATRDAIVRAAIETFMTERTFAITLAPVAERAGVTVKTILRHFGSREALIDVAWSQVFDEVLAERVAPPDDPEAALDVLIEHYERRGDMALNMIADEDIDARARRMGNRGREFHRVWVEEVFGARLPKRPAERSRLVDALVVATDVYSWKLLRIDRKLSVEDVHDRMLLMANAILAAPTASHRGAKGQEAS